MSGKLVTAAIFDTREEREVVASMLRAYGIHVVVPTVTQRMQGHLMHVLDRDLEAVRALIAETGSNAYMPHLGDEPRTVAPALPQPDRGARGAHGPARFLIAAAVIVFLCAALYAVLIAAGLDGPLGCLLLADPSPACN